LTLSCTPPRFLDSRNATPARNAGPTVFQGERLAIVRLEGLSVFGHHGARPYEKEAGQRLEVDLELEPADDRAEKSDKLGDAVDYDALYHTVREVVEGESFHLLEALAARTAETLLDPLPDSPRARALRQAEPGLDDRRAAR
jgi:dihydroneopterin aldolase